jgi:ketosteroid isomerase-like protein
MNSFVLTLGASLLALMAMAQPQIEATHNELRALRDGLLDAMNKGDIERQLSYLHTNVVVTWHNAEVSRGREGVRAYYNRLTSGPEKMVKAFRADITVDELTILHGDNTGIAFGSSTENFTLTSGRDFQLKGRWSATLVKEGGRWLIASLHASTNIFDNSLLNIAKKTAIWAGIACLVGGVIVGWLIGRKRKAAA